MSGMPNKTENDIIKNKNEYIESLTLQTKINKMNYDANELYKKTGQVMPIIGLNDNRSIEDKLLDVENLKQSIAKTIGTISSLTFGTNVVQALMNSPFNVNNSLIVFTAQRINEIILNLKKIYAIGIKGDPNDIQQLVNFIVKMYSDANAFTKTAKNFIDVQPSGPLNPGGLPNLDSMQNVKNILSLILPQVNNLSDNFRDNIQGILPANLGFNVLEEQNLNLYLEIFEFVSMLNGLSGNLTRQQVQEIIDRANDYNFNQGPLINEARFILEFLSKVFPNPNLVKAFWDKNSKFLNLTDKFTRLVEDMRNNGGNGPYSESIRDAYRTSLNKNKEILLNFLEILNTDGLTVEQLYQNGLRIMDFFANMPAQAQPQAQPQAQLPAQVQPQPQAQLPAQAPVPQNYQIYIPNQVNALTPIQLDQLYQAIPNAPMRVPLNPMLQQDFGQIGATDAQKRQACIQALILASAGNAYDPQQGVGNFGIQGLGITAGNGFTKRRRGRPKGSGVLKPYSQTVQENLDLTRGIQPTGKFIKFGKYLLNSHKLNKENIFSLKHSSGGNIVEIPSSRLTDNLGKVFKTIIGGGNPSYNELNKLSDSEQKYLHKVCSKSNILDKISIPTPSKDSEEKEIHSFEVMKGEIMSGNDSPELIKKFKLLIIKLQKNNSLPKKEVYEILEDLVSLGY